MFDGFSPEAAAATVDPGVTLNTYIYRLRLMARPRAHIGPGEKLQRVRDLGASTYYIAVICPSIIRDCAETGQPNPYVRETIVRFVLRLQRESPFSYTPPCDDYRSLYACGWDLRCRCMATFSRQGST